MRGYSKLMIAVHWLAGVTLILILAGLHGAIALWHQFVLRDNTLLRMLPVRVRAVSRGAR